MNKEFIDFLKSKISLVDVISSRVRLRKSGKDWFGLCPFHGEKTGSFKVDADNSYYYCFGCGAHGDAITFIQEIEKIGFSEAVEQLANSYGIPLPQKEREFFNPNKRVYEALNEIKNWFAAQLNEPAGRLAREYLETRKISKESIEKFQLGYAANNDRLITYLKNKGFSANILLKTGVFSKANYRNGLVNRYDSRLIFPILDSVGKCVGFGGRILEKIDAAKYINSPETELFIKSNHLYGYSLARRGKTREIILTEGYLDVISMHQAGFDGAVAPLGTSISETQINMCWRVCDNPVISLDGDSAGVKASYRWVDKILPTLQPGKSFKFAKLPQGTDPDMLIANGQSDVISESIKTAAPLSDWIWDGAFSLYPSETPEQKAAVIKMLLEKTETIRDASIKKLYTQSIKDKERNLYRKKNITTEKKANIRPVVSVKGKLEKIFIVTIINHPYIVDKVVENFVKIDFNDFQMRELKERILDCYNANLGDKDKYADAIKKLGLEISDTVEDVALHAEFISKNATDDMAEEGWFKAWERYSADPLIAKDLQIAASSLKSTFSVTDWQRLKALKKEVITNRTKKQGI